MDEKLRAIGRPVNILLVEDNPGDIHLIQQMLAEVKDAPFGLEYAVRLSTGLERLAEGGIDLVLLDLSLPDSNGINTLVRTRAQPPEVPIVVLTGLDDETLAIEAVREGAQDYLVKEQVDGNLLVRSMRYAIERQRLLAELRSLSLIDDLTGLNNRRGFFTLAQQQLKLAKRTKRVLSLVIADLDGLKQINDSFGHEEGDLALIETAIILKETFRESDVIGRIGGDEFAVIMVEDNKAGAEILTTRFQNNLDARNAKEDRRYKLSISIGMARSDPESSHSIDELLARADVLMYEQKRGKHKSEG